MAYRRLFKFMAVIGIMASSAVAFAQSPACNRYRAELASLDRGGGSPAGARLQQELGRVQEQYNSIGCDRRGFFSAPPPAECPAIAQRIRSLSANLDRVQQGQSRVDIENRRQQLISAINQECMGGDSRNFFDRLFNPRQEQQPVADPNAPISEDDNTPRLGGSRTVCVRMCDGYYFPLATSGKASPDEMCQALCPATETRAFSMPAADDGLSRAVSLSGKTPYTALGGAFRFQRNLEASCYCKPDSQKWANVLNRAEQLLDRHDTIISAERAAELSRAPALRGKQAAIAKQIEQVENAESQAAAKEGESAPTAGGESAGIGPQSIEGRRIVGRTEGIKMEGKASNNTKRTIRVITPSSLPPNQLSGSAD